MTPVTNSVFIADFGNYLEHILVHSTNIVILGDMNIHYTDDLDRDTLSFCDLLTATGLQQHISFPTHKSGNMLDLVITKSYQDIKVSATIQGPWMSHHCFVQCYCNLPNLHTIHIESQYRKIKEINISDFQASLTTKLDALDSSLGLDNLIDQFSSI